MKKSTATDVNKYQKLNSIIYMTDSDQRPNSNRRPLLKSAPTDVIISNHGRSDLRVLSCRRPFQILRSMADLLVRVRAYISDIIEKVRNEHIFENWKMRGLTSI